MACSLREFGADQLAEADCSRVRLVASFQVFAQLADLILDAACSVHRYPGFVVPVPGVGQVAFDAVDKPVNPPGDRVIQILHQCVSGRPVVSQKALDRVRKLLGVRSFHGSSGVRFKSEMGLPPT
jgi:hypothetical protein